MPNPAMEDGPQFFRLDLLVGWLATKGKFYIALRFPTACRDRRSGDYGCKGH
jgi:hypothetical protein